MIKLSEIKEIKGISLMDFLLMNSFKKEEEEWVIEKLKEAQRNKLRILINGRKIE